MLFCVRQIFQQLSPEIKPKNPNTFNLCWLAPPLPIAVLLTANRNEVSVKKTFSISEPYKTEEGKQRFATVQCTVFEDLSYAFHSDQDNPNFQFAGISVTDLERISAQVFCINQLSAKVIDYIRSERRQNSKSIQQ